MYPLLQEIDYQTMRHDLLLFLKTARNCHFQGESGAIQEDLESAFLRGDGNFTVVRDGKEFRLQFFMNPMCEKSLRPYSRKHVRRRPQFKSPEEIQLLTRSTTKTKRSWFKIFWWG